MNHPQTQPNKRVSHLQPHIITLKVMVSYNPLDQHQVYYSVAPGKLKPAGFFAKKRHHSHIVGKAFCPSLIFALTQDAVLEAISPVKGEIK